jgi:hypothetical protein
MRSETQMIAVATPDEPKLAGIVASAVRSTVTHAELRELNQKTRWKKR